MPVNREDIINQLLDNQRAMKQSMQSYMQHMAKRLPVSRAQLELLFALHHMQPAHSKQLAEHFGLTPGAVSQLVDKLFSEDLVARTPDPSDRRLQSLKLTKKGTKLIAGLEKERHELMGRVIRELQTDELAIWLGVQQKMIKQLDIEYNQHRKKETK